MSRAVEAATVVPLSPEHARGLWTDVTRVELRIDYELFQGGPFQAMSDRLFIRRALRDALELSLIHI